MDEPAFASQHPPDVVEQVMRALRTYVGSVETYMESMRTIRRMHRTDLGALATVMDHATRGVLVTPTELGGAIGLSTSATSSMLDRLERSGHVIRARHPDDRRSIVIEVTPLTLQMGYEIFGRLGQATASVMDDYSAQELHLIARFLEQVSTASVAASQPDD